MKIIDILENVDVDLLDAFEQTVYHDYLQYMSKPEALQKIIDNAEGDYTQLSEILSEIAQLQNEL